MKRVLLVGACALALSAAGQAAWAAFDDSGATAQGTFGSAQLQPPTGLQVQVTCPATVLGVTVAGSVTLTWTPSPTEWADRQVVRVSTGGGTTVSQSTVSRTTTTSTASLGLVSAGTYVATVEAGYLGWTSQPVLKAFAC